MADDSALETRQTKCIKVSDSNPLDLTKFIYVLAIRRCSPKVLHLSKSALHNSRQMEGFGYFGAAILGA